MRYRAAAVFEKGNLPPMGGLNQIGTNIHGPAIELLLAQFFNAVHGGGNQRGSQPYAKWGPLYSNRYRPRYGTVAIACITTAHSIFNSATMLYLSPRVVFQHCTLVASGLSLFLPCKAFPHPTYTIRYKLVPWLDMRRRGVHEKRLLLNLFCSTNQRWCM